MKIERILCPIDFSATSEHGLLYAIDLARELRARVTVLHVYEMSDYLVPEVAAVRIEMLPQAVETARRDLGALVARYGGSGIALEPILHEGTARTRIVKTANEIGAQLIVMGSHGRGGMSRMLLGSVTERVLRTSEVPVLVVRDKPA